MAAGSVVCPDLVAGEFSFIGPGCTIGPKVELGPYAMIGPRVAIVGGDHVYDRPGVPIIFSGRPELKPTFIEADAWIGCGAILMAGVRIAGARLSRPAPSSRRKCRPMKFMVEFRRGKSPNASLNRRARNPRADAGRTTSPPRVLPAAPMEQPCTPAVR